MLVQKNKKLSANNAKDANKSLLNHSSGSIIAWAVGCAVRTEMKIINGCFMVRTAHPTDLIIISQFLVTERGGTSPRRLKLDS